MVYILFFLALTAKNSHLHFERQQTHFRFSCQFNEASNIDFSKTVKQEIKIKKGHYYSTPEGRSMVTSVNDKLILVVWTRQIKIKIAST